MVQNCENSTTQRIPNRWGMQRSVPLSTIPARRTSFGLCVWRVCVCVFFSGIHMLSFLSRFFLCVLCFVLGVWVWRTEVTTTLQDLVSSRRQRVATRVPTPAPTPRVTNNPHGLGVPHAPEGLGNTPTPGIMDDPFYSTRVPNGRRSSGRGGERANLSKGEASPPVPPTQPRYQRNNRALSVDMPSFFFGLGRGSVNGGRAERGRATTMVSVRMAPFMFFVFDWYRPSLALRGSLTRPACVWLLPVRIPCRCVRWKSLLCTAVFAPCDCVWEILYYWMHRAAGGCVKCA